MACRFESDPAHHAFSPTEIDHGRDRRNPGQAGTQDDADAARQRHPVRSRFPPQEAGAHRQDGRLPPRQGADDRGGPALRLLGAVRGDERQGRRGLRRGRQRGQAARGRPAEDHREGRRARGRAGLRRRVRGVPRSEDRRPAERRGREARHRGERRRRSTARWTSCASSAAPSPARPGRRRAGRRPRDRGLRRQDRRRALRGRQGRGLPVHGRRRPDAQGVRRRRARHEGRREQDLPAGLPGRLPRQGRGRQDGRLHGHREEARGRPTCRR